MASSVFLTGANGFIGSHLAEELVRQGYKVKALAEYNSYNDLGWLEDIPTELRSEIEVVLGDVRDANFILQEIKGIDNVLHLAALISIPYSYVAPQAYVDTNISGTLNVLNAAKIFNANVIHTSTSEVYGTAEYVPIDEKHVLKGQSPYSASKIGADQLAYSFHAAFGLNVKIVRPFNTFGPRQSMRAVIPVIIRQILSGAKEIKLGATSPKRDFNFIEDTVSGFVSALKSRDGIGEATNIGSGYEISIGDTANVISEIMGEEINLICDDNRLRPKDSEVERLMACNRKAKINFGWEPAYFGANGLKRGLEKTIKWFSLEENIKKYKDLDYQI